MASSDVPTQMEEEEEEEEDTNRALARIVLDPKAEARRTSKDEHRTE